ncbi:MAG: nucleotidyltransferase substrate binding protein [Geovibrio sp.]|nr:nucleotidyltransferase substrate binding protein [Geovibrio sp.]
MAARENLITDPLPWFSYAETRNLSAHTYNSKNADYIYGAAGRFLFDAKKLLSALEQVND